MKHFPLIIILLISFYILFAYFFKETPDEVMLREAKELSFLPPYYNIQADYFTAYQYNLTTCSIRKSMSQMVFNTMCLLHDPETFLNGNHSISETWKTKRTCNYEDKDGFAIFPEEYKNTSTFTRIVFIRDPFDRFLSFYLDKCVRENFCFNCNSDMRCVVKHMYENLNRHVTSNQYFPADFDDMHTAPLSWYCEFDRYLKAHHVLLIGSNYEKRRDPIFHLTKILERKNVSERIVAKIVKDTLLGDTPHETLTSEKRKIAEQQIKTDPIVREYLHKIYLYDYLIFPFDKSQLDHEYQNGDWDKKYENEYSHVIQIQKSNAKLLN